MTLWPLSAQKSRAVACCAADELLSRVGLARRHQARARARRRILSARNPRPPAPAGALNWRARYLARPQADCRGRERSPQASIPPPRRAPPSHLIFRLAGEGSAGGEREGGRQGEGRAPQRACAPQRTSSARPRGGALPLSLLCDALIAHVCTCPLPYLHWYISKYRAWRLYCIYVVF